MYRLSVACGTREHTLILVLPNSRASICSSDLEAAMSHQRRWWEGSPQHGRDSLTGISTALSPTTEEKQYPQWDLFLFGEKIKKINQRKDIRMSGRVLGYHARTGPWGRYAQHWKKNFRINLNTHRHCWDLSCQPLLTFPVENTTDARLPPMTSTANSTKKNQGTQFRNNMTSCILFGSYDKNSNLD